MCNIFRQCYVTALITHYETEIFSIIYMVYIAIFLMNEIILHHILTNL
jgi:hypothetical protein